jgi:hypothetical protein
LLAGWAGGLAFWCVLLLGFTAAGLGSGYLALWWVLPAAAALVLAVAVPYRGGAWLPLGLVPGALVTAEAGVLLVEFFVPLAGRMLSASPLDPLIAVLVAVPVLAVATLGLALVQRPRALGAAAAVLCAVGLAATVGMALVSPYTAQRPKRLSVVQSEQPDGTARVSVAGGDAGDLGPLLRGGPLPFRPSAQLRVYSAPVQRAALPLPATEVSSSPLDPTRGTRTVRLRVAGGDYRRLTLTLPRERLAGWSLSGTLPALPRREDGYLVRIIPGQGRPWEATFELRGAAPVEARLSVIHAPASAGAVLQVIPRLPRWVVASSRLVQTTVIVL